MAQRGRIHKNKTSWFLTYRQPEIKDGKKSMRQIVKKLAPVGDQYRTEASVRALAEEILGPLNAGTARPESTQKVSDFLTHYLEHCKLELRPSTVKCYQDMFKMMKPHLGNATLREFRAPEVDKLMKDTTSDKQRAHTTHRNLKSFLSGAFKYAKRTGAVNENPVRDALIPRGLPKNPRAAYTLDEISTMLKVLPEPSRTVVLVAALTGLRLSELKGLRWEDFADGSVMVSRGVWNGIVSGTKTLDSNAPVPVVPQVLEALAEHRAKNSGTGFVFHGSTGNPLRMENLYRNQMQEPLAAAKVAWRGWHSFRAGVGTTLHELGVNIKLIQEILRHSDQKLTAALYVKPTSDKTREAMLKLETALGKSLARGQQSA